MRIFNSIDEIQNTEPAVIALGNFDGVHMGHQELIKRATNSAKAAGYKSAVFTFANHPRNVLGDKPNVKNIIYTDEKARIIESLGVDYLFNIPFDEYIMNLSPEAFIEELLVGHFQMKEAYCGFNYHFGHKAAGTPEMLTHFGIERGFGVHILSPFRIDGNLVSSTYIRELIENGQVDKCEKYMGRNYAIEGEVVVGNRLGKKIGFPTSNINLDEAMVSPPNGVYITQCVYHGVTYPSITNIGNKPTIGEYHRNMETHIFNFDKELYGKILRVEFLDKIRDERKFDSVEELSMEITRNCITAKAYHRSKGKALG